MSETIDKIRKLLAMAEHANTNPNEAANAAAMAAMLAAKHNIDLDAARATGTGPTKSFVDAPAFKNVKWRRRDDAGATLMAQWVGRLFGCSIVIHSWGDERWAAFKGQSHNIALSESWYEYLWNSCKRANTEHARSESRSSFKEREIARATFRHQFCVAVSMRLKQKYEAMQSTAVSGSTALVVAAWFETERKEVELWLKNQHPDMKMHNVKPPSKRDLAAAAAGKLAGNRVSLADQIASAAPKSAAIK